jgi:hypothetical protein
MNIIITEDQYERIGRYETCPTQVTFSVYKRVVGRWKQRTRCVSDEFYDLLQYYQEHKFEDESEISEKLKELIYEYYYKTYYLTPDEYEIEYITGNVVNIKEK